MAPMATDEINVDGYRQVKVVIEAEEVSAEEQARRRAHADRLQGSQGRRQEIQSGAD